MFQPKIKKGKYKVGKASVVGPDSYKGVEDAPGQVIWVPKEKTNYDQPTQMKYLGNFSAVDPAYSRHMECWDCMVSWTGCWDNFQCPKCGEGELPSSDLNKTIATLDKIHKS